MKTLFVVTKGLDKPSKEELKKLENEDKIPRVTLLEDAINAELLDEHYLERAPYFRKRFIYAFLPVFASQIIEGFLVQGKYDAILSYTEKIGLPLAYLQKIFHSPTPHVLITTWISGKQKAWFLKRVHSYLERVVMWSSVQHQFVINNIHVPANRTLLLKRGVDQKFWRPMDNGKTDMICSVGMEMRDYPTLLEAIKGCNEIKCHIAAGTVKPRDVYDTARAVYEADNIPANVTVGRKEPRELRELYARSRFVVVPLLPTDTDNGLTSTLEAMAMGKPVICSRVKGQVDVIRDGKTGILVPQGDPDALRDAINYLWNNPEVAEKMGQEARTYIEENHTLEQWVDAIKGALQTAIDKKKATTPKFKQVQRVDNEA